MNFYHYEKILVKVLHSGSYVYDHGGRVEVFNIDDDEQLIGCKLHQNYGNFEGVTWMKMQVPK